MFPCQHLRAPRQFSWTSTRSHGEGNALWQKILQLVEKLLVAEFVLAWEKGHESLQAKTSQRLHAENSTLPSQKERWLKQQNWSEDSLRGKGNQF
jgi:hypothetical protein